MKCAILFLLLFSADLCRAQTAAPLDTEAAGRALSTVPARPKLVSKGIPAPVKSRTYVMSKGVGLEIIEKTDGSKEELPFISVPVLFVVNSDELLDAGSRENLRKVCEIVRKELAKSGSARFKVEGHTSKEGTEEHNQMLSEARARKVVAVLTQMGIPEDALMSEGLGESQAKIAEMAPESQRQQERRVIVGRDH